MMLNNSSRSWLGDRKAEKKKTSKKIGRNGLT
jgi:hypothetical protein